MNLQVLQRRRGCRHDVWHQEDDEIYLPDELKAALERTASAQGTSEAEVIGSALVAATSEPAYPKPRLPLFDSGDPTLAERVDDALAAGFGE